MFKIFRMRRLISICCVIIFIFFVILYYKKFFLGNNIVKNRKNEILNSIINYEAEMNVEIISNKNTNQYSVYQKVLQNECIEKIYDENKQELFTLRFENGNLEILNEELKLEKVYQNFNDLSNNALFLNEFAKEYVDSENLTNEYEDEKSIYFEVELTNNKNTYSKHKILEINKETLEPIKLEIKDENQNKVIIIEYINIELN